MEENKFKSFIKNNFIYFIIAFACIAYIAYGMVKIETSGKTILEIIGSGVIIFLIGYAICFLFSLQGMMSGDKQQDVINTNKLHSKCVGEIDPKINEMDDWCDKENVKTLKRIRQQILNREGLKYDDCFDEEGIAIDYDFSHTEPVFEIKKKNDKGELETKKLTAKEMKQLSPQKYKMEMKRVRVYNKRQELKRKAYLKAMRVKITQLSTDAITATTVKQNDPHNLGMDKRQYQKREARSDLITKAICAIIFSYFSFSFILGWAYLISSCVQVAIFLLMGGAKFIQSYYFITEDFRKRTVRQINYIQRFKCDKGLITKEEAAKEIESIKGGNDYGVNIRQMETESSELKK